MSVDYSKIIEKAKTGIVEYLNQAVNSNKIDRQSFETARQNTITNIEQWLNDKNIDTVSPNTKAGIVQAIEEKEWQTLVNAFRKSISFGTGGIRGLMAFDRESIVKLKEDGIDAKILKGPNTLNNIVLLKTSAGVAQFGQEKGYNKIVIGYDSRIRGYDFARIIAELFLAYDFTVYLFDAPCPYPEVTFAIPYKQIKAHIGILISASHNDYRYNGYKLSCGNGSQFDPEERNEMYDKYIKEAKTSDIKIKSIKFASPGKIFFLGGEKPLADFDYMGHEHALVNIHPAYSDHIKSFLINDKRTKRELDIAYCAFHGAGRLVVPQILNDIGFERIKKITKNGLYDLNGLFPSFNSDRGKEQQPDPGDPRAAETAVKAFKQEYLSNWDNIDILIGTDPDADRCGVVVKIPPEQRDIYYNQDHMLMPADDMWALLVWFRLKYDKSINPENTFIVLSHTTTDCIVKVAQKYGVGVIKTWVGFAALAAGVRDTWENKLITGLKEGRKQETDLLCNPFIQETYNMDTGKRNYNLAAMEQSNGFSILGLPPKDKFSLGEKGHVRDKDGTFAAVLIAEIADWAKKNNTTIYKLIDEKIYLDPEIGLFVNHYEPDPLDGEYPGIEGDKIKKSILRRVLGLFQFARAGGLIIGDLPVATAVIYRTGKYDHVYPPTPDFQFPDEGVRFYFDEERLNYLTIRPSGTTNSLRFHVQVHSFMDKNNLIEKKKQLHVQAKKIVDHIRELLKAPRSSEL